MDRDAVLIYDGERTEVTVNDKDPSQLDVVLHGNVVQRTREAIDKSWGNVSTTFIMSEDAARKFQAYARARGVKLFQRRPPAQLSLAVQLKEERAQRQRKKRHERRMLALGRRLLREAGEPTAGGHRRTNHEEISLYCDAAWPDCEQSGKPSPVGPGRSTLIEQAESWLDHYARRASKCSQCGEREAVQPCANPCPDPEMPF